MLLGGFALVGAALGYLAGAASEPVRRALWSGGLAVALVVGVLLPGPGIPVTGTSDEEARSAGLSAEQVDALDGYVRAQLDALRLPGAAVAVVHGDDPTLVRGYGVAGPDRHPMAPDTPFVMASISKGFTALAVLQLVEAGDVDLDAPVREYLPWFETRNQEETDAMTVRHLLNQTSGFTTPQGWNLIERSEQHTIEDDVRAAADHALHDPPGTSYEYSNVNFQTAGAIIEAVTGRSYEEYMESEVFGPLGMVSTSAGDEDAHASGLADGYRDWWGVPVAAHTTVIEGAVPMGGISSSAADMANYLEAHLNGGTVGNRSVASEATITALHEDVVPTDPDDEDPTDFYGFGWNRSVDRENGDDEGGTVTLGHDGVAPGFSSGMRIRPGEDGDNGWGVVSLVNRQSAVAQPGPAIADGVLEIVTGESLHPAVGGRPAWNLVVFGLVLVVAAGTRRAGGHRSDAVAGAQSGSGSRPGSAGPGLGSDREPGGPGRDPGVASSAGGELVSGVVLRAGRGSGSLGHGADAARRRGREDRCDGHRCPSSPDGPLDGLSAAAASCSIDRRAPRTYRPPGIAGSIATAIATVKDPVMSDTAPMSRGPRAPPRMTTK